MDKITIKHTFIISYSLLLFISYVFCCALLKINPLSFNILNNPTLLIYFIFEVMISIIYFITYTFINYQIKQKYQSNINNLQHLLNELIAYNFKINKVDTTNPMFQPLFETVYLISKQVEDTIHSLKILNSYVSHEVKNSISIINAKIQLNDSKEELLSSIKNIISGIENILALSEVKSSECHELIDLYMICAMVVDDYIKKYPQITLEECEEGVSEVYGKQHLFYCAISNLIDNAIKYGCNKPITISLNEQKGRVCICIKDQGIGINKDRLEEIFLLNYRLSNLKKNSYGVGLSLVKNVVDVSNGAIWVESKENAGTCFYIAMPVAI